MKFGVASVLCFLIVCVYQCNSFKILQKIKDYLHPTTPQPTVTPTLDDYEKDNPTTQIDAYDTYKIEDHDLQVTSKSSTNFERNSERPHYTPQNFPTVAPPDVYEVYPGMNKHSTTPTSSNHTIPPEEMNVDYYTDNQEILTTPQENLGGGIYDQINSEKTGLNTVVDSNFLCTTLKTSEQANTNELHPNQNETSQLLSSEGSEQPFIQPRPTVSQSSSSSTSPSDNFVFPDDPSLNEAEFEESDRSYNSAGDRPSVPVTVKPKVGAPVPVGANRNIINGPLKKCNKGSQLDDSGICKKILRK